MKYLLLTTTVLGFASSLLIANGRTDLQSAAQARRTQQQVGVALTSPASEDLAGLKLGVGVLLAAGCLTHIKTVAERSSSNKVEPVAG